MNYSGHLSPALAPRPISPQHSLCEATTPPRARSIPTPFYPSPAHPIHRWRLSASRSSTDGEQLSDHRTSTVRPPVGRSKSKRISIEIGMDFDRNPNRFRSKSVSISIGRRVGERLKSCGRTADRHLQLTRSNPIPSPTQHNPQATGSDPHPATRVTPDNPSEHAPPAHPIEPRAHLFLKSTWHTN